MNKMWDLETIIRINKPDKHRRVKIEYKRTIYKGETKEKVEDYFNSTINKIREGYNKTYAK